MRINNNMMAMNTHRQLGAANAGGAKSMEKLSSGFRINRAGDDAAGLAISEKMRGQIRGLNQASANSQDGISMIQTAEGALNETHAILQRMRELATQSSNDTNVGVDRSEIQKEMNQLSSEINRIGNTTEFNTQAVLKGDGKVNLKSTTIATDGKLTNGTDATTTEASQISTMVEGSKDGDKLAFTINGEKLEMTFTTGAIVASGGAALDATSVTANAATIDINGNTTSAATDRAAVVEAMNAMIEKNDTLKGNFKVTAGAGGAFTIEALSDGLFKGAAASISKGTHTVAAKTTAGTAVAGTNTAAVAANKTVDFAAVTTDAKLKDLVGTGMTINGQQIEFYNSNDGAYTGEAVGVNISTALAVGNEDATKAAELVKNIAEQLGSKLDGVKISQDTNTATTLNITASTAGVNGNKIEVKDGGVQENFKSNFQVGANQGQSMTIEIKDMRASALGLTGKAGDDGFTSGNSVTNGTNNNTIEAALDVSSHEKASASITVINDAIEKVSAQRSDLGAFQNRLEHTIKNLDTSAENLQAAEARIRDVDMAKEMMEQTKQNILAQASTAMLAQANSAPQSVLQLLG